MHENLKNQLMKKSVKELRCVAKELGGIKQYWNMKKDVLVEAIVKVKAEDSGNAKIEETVDNNIDNEDVVEKSKIKTAVVDADKIEYVKRVPVGTLIAFNNDERCLSGKIVRRSLARKMLKVENRRGQIFLVKFEDVVWVRTGKRWPKGVYNMLMGGRKNEGASR